jgi:hypothetical protein
MSIVFAGTFVTGWTDDLVHALKMRGIYAIGAADTPDPFALLVHRAKHLRAGARVVCATPEDVAPKHPQVEKILADLALAVLPPAPNRARIVIDADPHDYFAKCIAEGATGTHYEIVTAAERPPYLEGNTTKRVRAPAGLADTPGLLRDFLGKL